MIIIGKPPNFLQIASVFPAAKHKNTVFAYAPDIYVNKLEVLNKALILHEEEHIKRQKEFKGGPKAWWDLYLIDIDFRLNEEIVAHKIEYKFLLKQGNRAEKRNALNLVANRLSSSMYKFNINKQQARKLLEL